MLSHTHLDKRLLFVVTILLFRSGMAHSGDNAAETGSINKFPVIVDDAGEPIAGIAVRQLPNTGLSTNSVTDSHGRFELVEGNYPLLILAISDDRSKSGGNLLTRKGEIPRIPVGPSVTVTGRLLHFRNQKPIPGAWLECVVRRPHYTDDSSSHPGNLTGYLNLYRCVATAPTADDGSFEIRNVIPGQLFHLTVGLGVTNPFIVEEDTSAETVTMFRTGRVKQFDVGIVNSQLWGRDEVLVDKPSMQRVDAVLKERAALAPVDAVSLIRDASEKARAENKKLLVYTCHGLQGGIPAEFLPDPQRAILQNDFVLLPIQFPLDAEATRQQIEQLSGLPWPRWALGWIGILDTDGTVLTSSVMPEGPNIAFPNSQAGLEWLRTMLSTTAQRLSAEQIDSVISSIATQNRVQRTRYFDH